MGTTIGIIGLFVAIALLVVLAFKGHSVIIAAPIAALIAVLFSYGLKGHFMASYTITYMSGFANYAKNYFSNLSVRSSFCKVNGYFRKRTVYRTVLYFKIRKKPCRTFCCIDLRYFNIRRCFLIRSSICYASCSNRCIPRS